LFNREIDVAEDRGRNHTPIADPAVPQKIAGLTGPQSRAGLLGRRLLFIFLVVTTTGLLVAWLMSILAGTVWFPFAVLMLTIFFIYAVGQMIWFWNALLGFVLLNWTRDPLSQVFPPADNARAEDPIVALTAIVMTVRNGDPARSFARFRSMKAALDQTDFAGKFHFFVLSDSSLPAVIASEERAYAAWQAEASVRDQIVYRHRISNVGFKSGNLHDFCEHWGSAYQFMVVLDADSLMTAAAVMRLIRIMQANPRLGILQTLPAGLPTESLFARIFQFGHYHHIRCFLLGNAWWNGDCCRPRGHNYAVCIAPFAEHCRMPALPGEENDLQFRCEDGVEGALMYRAGYEVRYLPDEYGSYEGYPPTLLEFLERLKGWCNGDMQNLRIFNFPNIAAMSRFHLLFVVQKYFGGAAAIAFALLAAVTASGPSGVRFPIVSAVALYIVLFAIYFAPQLFSIADAALHASHRYGGIARLLAGSVVEFIFAFLLMPITLFASANFLLAQSYGPSVKWEEHTRESYQLSWRRAARYLWPSTAFGLAIFSWLAAINPAAIPWFLPLLTGLILAVPLAVLSSSARLGALAARRHFCALPDEITGPRKPASIIPVLAQAPAASDK
jgi:membrane glycosyltransferase